MYFVWALAITGLFLIFLEFFLPSAIMAIGGAILLLSSLVCFHMDDPRFFPLLAYACSIVLATIAIIRIARWKVKTAKAAAPSESEGFQAIPYCKELIGKTGIAATDLAPSGQIWIEDRAFDARSASDPIAKGAEVQVLSGQGTSLLVKAKAPATLR